MSNYIYNLNGFFPLSEITRQKLINLVELERKLLEHYRKMKEDCTYAMCYNPGKAEYYKEDKKQLIKEVIKNLLHDHLNYHGWEGDLNTKLDKQTFLVYYVDPTTVHAELYELSCTFSTAKEAYTIHLNLLEPQ